MAKFRKKPVVIEAFQWNGTNVSEARGFFGKFPDWAWHLDNCEFLVIETLEGDLRVNPSDWIIKGVKGEFYPYKSDIFALTYEPCLDE